MKLIKRILMVVGGLVFACIILGVIASQVRPTAVQPTPARLANADTIVNVEPTEEASTTAPEPTAAPEPTTEPTPAPAAVGIIGEPREAGGVTLTVASVGRAAALGDFVKAEEGKEYVLVEVLLETTGRDTAPYNPLYFKVKDGEGYEYNAGIPVADNALKSGDLVQGDKVRGIVAFEVPQGASGLVLSYEPLVIAGGYEAIRVALD